MAHRNNEEFSTAFDKVIRSEDIVKETSELLATAEEDMETSASMMQGKGNLTGDEVVGAQRHALIMTTLTELQKSCLTEAKDQIKKATVGLAKLRLYDNIPTDPDDFESAVDELKTGLWYTNQATEEILAFKTLFEEESVTLYELLKL